MPETDYIPGFESIIGQQRPTRILSTFLRSGRIPHALLFSGIEGVGKSTTAMVFAMACNCDPAAPGTSPPDEGDITHHIAAQRPCGTCRSCRKIQSGHHPDILRVEPSGSMIKIAQIRSLLGTLAMRSYEAKRRVVIISDAQTMSPEASNALLKALEEPPDQTIIVLIAPQGTDLLPTIVSRCQHIRFNPIRREDLERLLVEKHGMEPMQARVPSMMANGSLSQALKLSKADWTDRRNRLITVLGLREVGSLSSRPLGSLLLFAENLSRSKEALSESLQMMKSWIRDLVISKYDPAKIINSDMAEEIQRASRKIGLTQLLSDMTAIQTAEREIQTNRNIRLITETLMMDLSEGSLPS